MFAVDHDIFSVKHDVLLQSLLTSIFITLLSSAVIPCWLVGRSTMFSYSYFFISEIIHLLLYFACNIIHFTYHILLSFNCCLTNLPLKSGHEWVITSLNTSPNTMGCNSIPSINQVTPGDLLFLVHLRRHLRRCHRSANTFNFRENPWANFFKPLMVNLWVWEKFLAPISVTLGQGH